ncbi:MAG: type II secretion system protein GspD [Methylophilaceae bacterium]|nr:MAG: type II secretion system protein GspD [Methylophilaceae bacterium]
MMTYMTGCATFPWPSKKQSGSPEQRVQKAQAQWNKDTDNTDYRKTLRLEKESAIEELLTLAEQARLSGNHDQAIVYYDRLLVLDPAHGQARQLKLAVMQETERLYKLKQAQIMYQEKQYTKANELVREILIEAPDMTEALSLQTKINADSQQTKVKAPQLKPSSDKPITLELRDANIKVVFEALSRATGINFVLDKDIKPDTKVTIFIKKMLIEDAIDMVLASNGLEKKALSSNSLLVFPNTPQKLKDYQDLIIRSFFLTNTTAKQVSAMLKTMLKTKDIFIDERLNMVVMRDTPDIIKIAEKLVQANDMADPEVMLDIEVLEVSRTRLQELGIIYPNQLAVIGANTGLTLEALRNVTSANVGVRPNPAVNFNKTTGDVNLLSNPRIRVKNNEKAQVLVGDKVPIITTTSTANVGVAENVTYVDVGLKLDVEPRINLDNFVNIKVGLEVSSLGDKTITRNGAEVFTIGTRNANTVLRLKHGETQILAGLILDDERKSTARLPGLGDIPLLGRLFSNQEDRKSKTEIVLAITPRILSNIQLPKADIAEYWSGTENLILDRPKISIPITNIAPRLTIDRLLRTQDDQIDMPTPDGKTVLPTSQPFANDTNNAPQSDNNTAKDLSAASTLGNEKPVVNNQETSSSATSSTMSIDERRARVLEAIKQEIEAR